MFSYRCYSVRMGLTMADKTHRCSAELACGRCTKKLDIICGADYGDFDFGCEKCKDRFTCYTGG
jgi:hypothetical protein